MSNEEAAKEAERLKDEKELRQQLQKGVSVMHRLLATATGDLGPQLRIEAYEWLSWEAKRQIDKRV